MLNRTAEVWRLATRLSSEFPSARPLKMMAPWWWRWTTRSRWCTPSRSCCLLEMRPPFWQPCSRHKKTRLRGSRRPSSPHTSTQEASLLSGNKIKKICFHLLLCFSRVFTNVQQCRSNLSLKIWLNERFTSRNKSGIWGWRSEKTEVVSGYEAKVRTSTRCFFFFFSKGLISFYSIVWGYLSFSIVWNKTAISQNQWLTSYDQKNNHPFERIWYSV